MQRLLDKLFHRHTINDQDDPNSEPYLNRWFILRRKWLPFQVYLHQILRSDHDRDLHDHPWWFVTFILWGGYVEHQPWPRGTDFDCETPDYKAYRRWPGMILFRRATHLHRLELTKPAWTLVIRGRSNREWGFVTAWGWMPWQEYLRRRRGPCVARYVWNEALSKWEFFDEGQEGSAEAGAME
jgi:hypothetical protein